MRYIRLFFVIVMLSGCIPYSDNPLTAPGEQPLDQAIMGTWYYHDDDETVFLHIGTDRETKGLRLVMVEFHKDGEIKTYVLVGHPSRVGDKTYMNLRWDQPDEPDKGYLFVKYNMMGEQVGFGLIRSDVVKKAILAGGIRGKIGDGQDASITLTGSSGQLRGYVQKHDKELFEEVQYMNRLNHSELSPSASGQQLTNEVSVREQQELSEKVYSLKEDSCEVSLTVYGPGPNMGVITFRSKCNSSWQSQLALFESVLHKVFEDEKQARSLHTLFWGRLAPDQSQSRNEMSYRLALAASQSPLWDKKRGRAKTGHENDCVPELAEKADIYRELKPIFAALNRAVKFSSAEKVLVMEAKKLPFFKMLKENGVQPDDRLPFDCITWFSLAE